MIQPDDFKLMLMTAENRAATDRGDKTQTRRVITDGCLQSIPFAELSPIMNRPPFYRDGKWQYELQSKVDDTDLYEIKPRYSVGDIVGIREPYRITDFCPNKDLKRVNVLGHWIDDNIYFSRTLTAKESKKFYNRKTTRLVSPSLHMYKSLVRKFIEITGVRVERLQDITRTDIRKEGLVCPKELGSDDLEYNYKNWYIDEWITLWNSINEKRGCGWDKNPWVFVYEYRKVEV